MADPWLLLNKYCLLLLTFILLVSFFLCEQAFNLLK